MRVLAVAARMYSRGSRRREDGGKLIARVGPSSAGGKRAERKGGKPFVNALRDGEGRESPQGAAGRRSWGKMLDPRRETSERTS